MEGGATELNYFYPDSLYVKYFEINIQLNPSLRDSWFLL